MPKIAWDLMSYIRRVIIEEIRGRRFRVYGSLGRESNEVELGRINVLTGCNGSFKTSILEALTASLLMLTDPGRAQSLFTVAMTLRMDDFWLYKLLGDGFRLMVDDVVVRTIGINDLIRLLTEHKKPLPPMTSLARTAVAESNDGKDLISLLETDVIQISTVTQQVQYNLHIAVNKFNNNINYDFMALSTPNPLTPQFVGSFMKLVDYAKAINLFNKVFEGLEISFVGLKPDEFDRNSIVFVTRDGEIPIQYLGSGYLSLALMVLTASRKIVIYDNVELHLHPWLMHKAAELMGSTKDVQWIITTQSSEMLEALLNNVDLNELLVIETSPKGLLRVYDGDEANRRVKKLDEDLRGSCL